MKKINLKMFAFAAIVSLALSGCAVHNREYNRRPSRDHRDYRNHHHHDDRRHHNNHY